MTEVAGVQRQLQLFPYNRWREDLPALARKYRENRPYPHIHLPELLEPEIAHKLVDEFPSPETRQWIQYKHHNENKLGLTKRAFFPEHIGQITDELNSPKFLAWLSDLTGIPGLMADPSFEGGGLHQSASGGFLNVHADFTMHHHHKNWRRRINLILYLNPGWKTEWRGAIELWDKQMSHCVARVEPLFNHALIFNTDEHSYHGFPERLSCPENVCRKSLALYYYTLEEEGNFTARSTNYRARPEDGWADAAMIWLDKQVLAVYSKAKARFGFSDDFVSKILGSLSRKKPARPGGPARYTAANETKSTADPR
jgi:hypothetical protein